MFKLICAALILLAGLTTVSAKTHKQEYPNSCSEVWTAVKDTLANPEQYEIKISDEARMAVTFSVKHSAHLTLAGALRQRPNSGSLSAKDSGCEMKLESNYSGIEHNDAGDFTKRLAEALAKPKTPAPPK